MSHFTTIQTHIKDIDALRAACKELGFDLIEQAEARGYESKRRGDFVVQLKGPYDIALNRAENGSYLLTTDWLDGYVEEEVGKKFGRLLQLYAVHKATRDARRRGLSVQRRTQSNGTIKLILQGA